MNDTAWLILAMGLSLLGYGTYLIGLRRHLVEPNRASWLIWAAAAGVEAATYTAVNRNAPQCAVFALSALACVVVTLSMWRRSRWSAPSSTEAICMGAALAALLLWVAFKEAFWAHMLVVLAVPISFWPTWQSVAEDRTRERSPAWALWTLGDLATVWLTVRQGDTGIGGLAYIVVEFACHASIWMMVGLTTIAPWRRHGRAAAGLLPANPFTVRTTHLGKAVFAARGFAAGETMLRFSGPRVRAASLHRPLTGAADRFVQIAADEYLGPSGRVDDLINHSCTPNAGLRFIDGGIFLIAIRGIAAGEEVAWDYSTTLADDGWRMTCGCGSAECRHVIGAFATLPAERQHWLLDHDLVAPYLRPPPNCERAA